MPHDIATLRDMEAAWPAGFTFVVANSGIHPVLRSFRLRPTVP